MAIKRGTNAANSIVGTSLADRLFGLGGNDTIRGGNGNDQIFGDGGNDRLFGNANNDVINGGIGNDYLSGDTGNDILNGDAGNDELVGGTGVDTLFGGANNDILRGGAGNDVLIASSGRDEIWGGTGTDRFVFDSRYGSAGTKFTVDVVMDYNDAQDFIGVRQPDLVNALDLEVVNGFVPDPRPYFGNPIIYGFDTGLGSYSGKILSAALIYYDGRLIGAIAGTNASQITASDFIIF